MQVVAEREGIREDEGGHRGRLGLLLLTQGSHLCLQEEGGEGEEEGEKERWVRRAGGKGCRIAE